VLERVRALLGVTVPPPAKAGGAGDVKQRGGTKSAGPASSSPRRGAKSGPRTKSPQRSGDSLVKSGGVAAQNLGSGATAPSRGKTPAGGSEKAGGDAAALDRVVSAVAAGRLDVNQVVSRVMKARHPEKGPSTSKAPDKKKGDGSVNGPSGVRRSRSRPGKDGGRGLQQLKLEQVGLRPLVVGASAAPNPTHPAARLGPATPN
jgi:hypothetical protein